MATARDHLRMAEKCLSAVYEDSEVSLCLLTEAQVHAALAVAYTLQEFFAPADIGIRPIADLNLPKTTTAPVDEATGADQ